MPEKKSLFHIITELIEIFFNSSRSLKRGRTWNQHVVPYEDAWAVRREGNKRITSKHRKQSTAINKAKALAKKYNADVIIHRENGEIRDRISFNDANPKK
ncbi:MULTISPECIES: DUF2188 domain-containing protein [Maribacter]|uniref:DUF2188 domain-containing protein n=1 Tax=Maribacter flavus TaxID=1658664 RepID=A0ABU7IHB7_9FLAO|nr:MULTISPECIES: DUF2188 domain-containing protein [Maribacter]MDC6404933.1 DUF2188 domain-containing protein [Maribacter sp. PR66]MEE1972347.1 DUF2188 domain-containing protein [Maribacter flavus]